MPSSLEKPFDATLYVNLDRRPDRREQSAREFEMLRFQHWNRIPGIDRPDNGNAGCTATHRLLWRRIAAGELGERVLIFEDDFMVLLESDLFRAGFTEDSDAVKIFRRAPWRPVFDAIPHLALNERWDAMAEHLPDDWDVLYLGGGYAAPPLERVSPFVIRNAGMLGTVAYAIRRSFADTITRSLDESHPRDSYPGPVDSTLCGFARAHRFYTMSPRLFIPRPGNVSDLNPGHVDAFPYSFTDPVHEMMV